MPILFYVITIVLFLVSIRFNRNDDFLDKRSSTTIKGLFILLIVFSHVLNSFSYGGDLATPLYYFRSILGQLIVSMFFFISGYGIIYSINKSGEVYSKSLFSNRFLRILFYTIISLVPYFIYCACLNKYHPVSDYFLSFIGLASFGNSSWFLFAILVCYFSSSIAFLFNYKHKLIPVCITTICVLIYIILFMIFERNSGYKYDTIICFPLGLFAGLYKDKINSILNKKPLAISLLPISIAVVVLCYWLNRNGITYMVSMTISNVFFCLFFVALTKLFTLRSIVLEYLGNASYAIFIMHQLVIHCFVDLGTIEIEWLNYFVLFTASTLIGIPFYYLYKLIDRYITNPIVNWNRNIIVKSSKDNSNN